MSRTKAEQVAARDAAEAFRLLLSSLTTVETTDANGYPVVTVGTITADGGGAYISFVPETTLQTDSLGISQRVYAPHRIRVAIEAGAVSGHPDADMSAANLLQIFQVLFKTGMKVEFWLESDGTGPSATTFDDAAKLAKVYYPDAYNPLRSQM
jgi:hypothetical protein